MKVFSIVVPILFLSAMATQLFAQEANPPQRVATSVGIYDVKSPEDIHKFSAAEVRELVRLENQRWQGVDTFPHPVLVYAFEERTFHYTGGKFQNAEITYRLRTPRTICHGRQYPLVVHLHGNGDDSLTHAHPILPLLIGPDQQDFFLLATQAPRGEDRGWYFQPATQDGPLDILESAIEHVIANNPIDKRRITATGISGGGWGVWQLLLKHPDLFAGAMPTACGAPSQTRQLAALTQTPIWVINNRGDVDPQSILIAMQVVRGAGGSMALTEADEPGHNSWRPAMEDYNGLQWMLAQKRGSWFAPAPGTIVNNPSSSMLVFVMYILPLAILVFLVFLLRETIGEQVETIRQTLRERKR